MFPVEDPFEVARQRNEQLVAKAAARRQRKIGLRGSRRPWSMVLDLLRRRWHPAGRRLATTDEGCVDARLPVIDHQRVNVRVSSCDARG